MIPVSKPFLPDRKQLDRYIDKIYENGWLTNDGPLVRELSRRLEEYLGVENLLLVANGTLALQIAYKVLGLKGQVVTTPFSFVATVSSLVWEGLTPVFADIDPRSLCIDPGSVEQVINHETSCILPVHVFGNSCDIDGIEEIAGKYGLRTIYDGAHAFGVNYKGKSILKHGDATILSFHATKLFHTVEGGAIVFKDRSFYEEARKAISFGIDGPDSIVRLGINAKMNELQAAVGLCVLDEIDYILGRRAEIGNYYEAMLKDCSGISMLTKSDSSNYSYFPVVFDNEETLLKVKSAMNAQGINPRRYFYPSLDTLPYINRREVQPISRTISERILCLPIWPDLQPEDRCRVIDIIRSAM